MRDLDLNKVKEAIRKSSNTTSILVGCDSSVSQKNKQKATYSRVVVLHIDSNRGAQLYGDVVSVPYYGSIRQRLMQEVFFATEISLELLDTIDGRPFEIHLDLNPSPEYKSNIIVKEAIGYVRGQTGIEPKLKPEAMASSTVADRFTSI
jgi:uncharacterized protein